MTCTRCDLHRTCKRVQIPGRGNPKPRVVFVGQAPGAQEDMYGRCFVGPAGMLLQEAIKKYDLKPAYLTNLVRCFPPADRDPKKTEIEACKSYLVDEIKSLQPEIVVLLGNIPLQALTGLKGITDYSGTVVRDTGKFKIFSLFHPSFILRYPRMQPKFEMHLRALKKLMAGESVPELPTKLVTAALARERIAGSDSWAFDFETTGKFKQFGGKLRTCGFASGQKSFVVSADDPGFFSLMHDFLSSERKRKIVYNSTFEIRWCIDEFGIEPQGEVLDPFLMHHLLNENIAHDLESVASHYLEADSWDVSALMAQKGWTYETIPLEHLAPYNAKDCEVTFQLAQRLTDKLNETKQWPAYTILANFARLCARMESRGIKIDTQWAAGASKDFEAKGEELRKAMVKLQGLPEDFNPNSALQLSKVLFDILKIKVRKKTDGGKNSTAKAALEPLRKTYPFVDAYLNWKHTFTLKNNFTDKFPRYAAPDGRIHSHFNPCGTVTGRASCTEPPVQTLPEEKEIRGMFISRFPNGKILSSDYDALELRIIASLADEPNLINIFRTGGDPHDITAADMFGKNFTQAQRKIAKRLNFGIAYGVTDYTLQGEFGMGPAEAVQMIEKFRKARPRIFQWMAEQHRFVQKYGYVRSPFGVIRHLPEAMDTKQQSWILNGYLRQAGNFPIQSAGAYITNQASVWMDASLKDTKSVVFHVIHDSCMVDVSPSDDLEKLLELNKNVMEDQMQTFCKGWMKVPLTITQSISRRWENED